jgi:hypothetical protein
VRIIFSPLRAAAIRCSETKLRRLPTTALKEVLEKITELGEILQGVSMIREVSPRLRARVCAFGEQMSTLMAVQILKKMGIRSTLVGSQSLHQDPANPLQVRRRPWRWPWLAAGARSRRCLCRSRL